MVLFSTLRPERGTPKEISLNTRGPCKVGHQHPVLQLNAGPGQTFVHASYIRTQHGEGVIGKASGALRMKEYGSMILAWFFPFMVEREFACHTSIEGWRCT